MDVNPSVFVVGCPRSGTTLLQTMLDHHPQLAVANDTHFIPLPIRGVPVGCDPPLSAQCVERLLDDPRFARLGLSEAVVSKAAAESRTYAEFVSALYGEFGRLRGKPLAGEKTPDYVRYLPLLHSLFPWARTVHVIRDGRDVALSTLQWAKEGRGPRKFKLWREEPLAVCALWWSWQVSTGRRHGTDLGPDRYYEVKYEHLVARPEQTLRRITKFLGLPFAPEMLTYHQGHPPYAGGRSTKVWLQPTNGLRDWRSQLAPRDVELFESLAGDLLSALGYERAFDVISPGISCLGRRHGSWWEAKIARRQPELTYPPDGALEPSVPAGSCGRETS
jgi:hypothetical protein